MSSSESWQWLQLSRASKIWKHRENKSELDRARRDLQERIQRSRVQRSEAGTEATQNRRGLGSHVQATVFGAGGRPRSLSWDTGAENHEGMVILNGGGVLLL